MRPHYTDPILIVEDDRNTASLVTAYLQREGFATTMVHDGREALRNARRQPPLLVPGCDAAQSGARPNLRLALDEVGLNVVTLTLSRNPVNPPGRGDLLSQPQG